MILTSSFSTVVGGSLDGVSLGHSGPKLFWHEGLASWKIIFPWTQWRWGEGGVVSGFFICISLIMLPLISQEAGALGVMGAMKSSINTDEALARPPLLT